MNYDALRIFMLSICLSAGQAYGMETELTTLASEENALEILQEMPQINQDTKDTFERDYEKQIKKATLEAQIKRRKLCNVLYAALTFTMMGIDIANSYWDEKGLFEQKIANSIYGNIDSCECPNRTTSCEISDGRHYGRETCRLTDSSRTLYVVNDSMTIWRVYSGFMNLYSLYQVQQALNAQSVSNVCTIFENKITCDEEQKSLIWNRIQGISAGAIGIIAGVAGVVNGFTNYPRSVAVWGANAAVDALGALNWYENTQACEEVIRQNNNMLEDVIAEGAHD